jgi:hypothetical protein
MTVNPDEPSLGLLRAWRVFLGSESYGAPVIKGLDLY